MTYGRCVNKLSYEYNINNFVLKRSDLIKDLGINFDSALTFRNHFDDIVKKSLATLGFVIRNTKTFTSIMALKILYYSLIRSRLEYGSVIWDPYYHVSILKLENVQRRFIKYLHYKEFGNYPVRGTSQELLLSIYNIEALCFRRTKMLIKFIYDLVHNKIDCIHLFSQIRFHVPRPQSRYPLTFSIERVRTNLGSKAPLTNMQHKFNTLCHNCDLHFDSLNKILKYIDNDLRYKIT